jgi:ketopantoate reductase
MDYDSVQGTAVTLIGREPHVEAIRRDGLVVVQGSAQWSVAVDAGTSPAAVADALGVAAPANQALHALVKLRERQAMRPG